MCTHVKCNISGYVYICASQRAGVENMLHKRLNNFAVTFLLFVLIISKQIINI